MVAIASVAAAGLALGALALARSPSGASCPQGASAMTRMELLFGMTRRDGSEIGASEWDAFVDREVTPRFPEGLTVLSGYGQWRNASGTIIRQGSRVLLVWHAPATDGSARVEAIREAYKVRFGQESVMRVDGTSCVSF